jgi:hypothetical protein
VLASSLSTLTGPTAVPPKGPNSGAIAGGIVGALVIAGIVAGVIFWYIRKKKRATEEMDVWLSATQENEASEKDPSVAPSHHSVPPLFDCLTIDR